MLVLAVFGLGFGRAYAAPADPAPAKPESKPAITCKLLTPELPRGGRMEVEGDGFGKAPLVRIAGRVTRIIERAGNRIAVQVHRDSDGGAVTIRSGNHEATCGELVIIGKN